MATPHDVGRALYRLFHGQEPEQELDVPNQPSVVSRSETRRVIRKYPDGSVEIVEQIVTDDRAY